MMKLAPIAAALMTLVVAVSVRADEAHQVGPVTPIEAVPFSHGDVRILSGPFKHAEEMGKQYLLALDVDRLIAPCYEAIDLKPKKPRYGGWEAQGISGHMLGHWLSGAARLWASTGDPEIKRRLDYAISELAALQDKRPDGYVSGFPHKPFDAVFSGTFQVQPFNLAGHWVPWYTMHKIFAGLIDAHVIGRNAQALTVATKLGDWAKNGTDKLNDEQFQRMLRCEHGGMMEVMADLYALTGQKKYLELSERFAHKAVFDPLSQQHDALSNLHANTQIPKIVGAARIYELTGKEYYKTVATYFWEEVTGKRSYAFGGNSISEHFPALGKEPLGPNTAETCNTYNMLRLTRELMEWKTDSRYGDYYERALYNHILASQDPDTGMMMYFMSTKPGHFKVYSTPFESMWCCTGSGIENPGRYNEAIYFHNADTLWVNLFIPSEVQWKEKGLTLRQETTFPESDRTKLTLSAAPSAGETTLKLRVPYWAAGPVAVAVNGQPAGSGDKPGWVTLKRAWKAGDTIDMRLPMKLHLHRAVDDPQNVAIMYGPIVLAAEMGKENFPASDQFKDQNTPNNYPAPAAPVIVADNDDVTKWVSPVEGKPLTFTTTSAKPGNVTLIPMHRLHHERYTVYLKQMTPDGWAQNEKAMREKEAAQAALESRTIDQITPGEQQPDVDHALAGERTSPGSFQGRSLRHAENGGWFSYQIKVRGNVENVLRLTYWGGETGQRTFEILVDGTKIAEQRLANNKPGEFFDVEYPLPENLTSGKEQVELKFAARPGNFAGGVFGIRVLKK
jgi:DUF1680 family protein